MLTYSVTHNDTVRTGGGTDVDQALGDALVAVLQLQAQHAATHPDTAMDLCTIRIGEEEPILIRDTHTGDAERDHINLAAFLTQLYRDLTNNPFAMLPTEPPASA